MNKLIDEILKEFRNKIYGKDDALFDRSGNNVSQQVENVLIELLSKAVAQALDEVRINREKLAELEHKQWLSWTNYLVTNYILPPEIVKKWGKTWKPYKELSEGQKDKDRIWADKVLNELNQKIKKLKEGR